MLNSGCPILLGCSLGEPWLPSSLLTDASQVSPLFWAGAPESLEAGRGPGLLGQLLCSKSLWGSEGEARTAGGDGLSLEKLPGLWQRVSGLLGAFQAPPLPLRDGEHPFVHLMTPDLRSRLPVAPIPSGARNQIANPHTPEPWPHRSFRKCVWGREGDTRFKTCLPCSCVKDTPSGRHRRALLSAGFLQSSVPQAPPPFRPRQHAAQACRRNPRRGNSR